MLIISDEKFAIKIKLADENGMDVTADILSPGMGIKAAVNRAIASVSYTHLDVYKRQVRGSYAPAVCRRIAGLPWHHTAARAV